MSKDKRKSSLRPSTRPASTGGQTTRSWVKHGHKKLYLLGGIVLVAVILGAWALSSSASATVKVGEAAPDFTFTRLDGSTSSLQAYLGHPVVLWWIATWCSSCQDGTHLFAQNYYSQYNSSGVLLLQIESYNNLGQSGPDLSSFATSYGYVGQKNWVLGAGSQGGTTTYNSVGYLDYYYVISSKGVILDEKAGLPQYFGTVLTEAAGH